MFLRSLILEVILNGVDAKSPAVHQIFYKDDRQNTDKDIIPPFTFGDR